MARYQTPPDALSRIPEIIAATQTNVELAASSRSLAQASVGSGGLTYKAGTRLELVDGGNLDVSGGDLILGESQIQGDALKNLLSASQASARASGFSTSTSWATKASKTVTPPSWASTAMIICSGAVTARDTSTTFLGSAGYQARLQITYSGGTYTGTAVNGTYSNHGSASAFGTAAFASAARSVSAAGTITVAIQAKASTSGIYGASGSSVADISAAIMWWR